MIEKVWGELIEYCLMTLKKQTKNGILLSNKREIHSLLLHSCVYLLVLAALPAPTGTPDLSEELKLGLPSPVGWVWLAGPTAVGGINPTGAKDTWIQNKQLQSFLHQVIAQINKIEKMATCMNYSSIAKLFKKSIT